MAAEIERKFLVTGDGWRTASAGGQHLRQGYISREPGRTVRVRLAGEQGWLTLKGPTEGIRRAEFEYAIPAADARELLDTLCQWPQIEKVRHRVMVADHLWEVDEFLGDNAGLILAEVELARVDEQPVLPTWVGAEVSDDPRYFNASLSREPYRQWGDKGRR